MIGALRMLQAASVNGPPDDYGVPLRAATRHQAKTQQTKTHQTERAGRRNAGNGAENLNFRQMQIVGVIQLNADDLTGQANIVQAERRGRAILLIIRADQGAIEENAEVIQTVGTSLKFVCRGVEGICRAACPLTTCIAVNGVIRLRGRSLRVIDGRLRRRAGQGLINGGQSLGRNQSGDTQQGGGDQGASSLGILFICYLSEAWRDILENFNCVKKPDSRDVAGPADGSVA